MIKINLALRKQSAAVLTRDKLEAPEKKLKFDIKSVDLEFLKSPELRKLALVIVVAVVGTYVVDGMKQDMMDKADQQITKATADNTKAKAELAKTSGYEEIKKQIDTDEELIRTKLLTIQKLIADRQLLPKMLMSLSSGIPKDVWLTELNFTGADVQLKGSALGLDPVTDFLKTLNENDMLTDVKLENSEKAKDPLAGEVMTFEMDAKKK